MPDLGIPIVLASGPAEPPAGAPPAGAPAGGTPTTAPADGDPGAGDAPSGNMFTGMFPILLVVLIMYFLLFRPQAKEKKKREAMLSTIKKGDRVVTTAGLHGTVVTADATVVVLTVADGVRLKFDRAAIWRVERTEESDLAVSVPSEKS